MIVAVEPARRPLPLAGPLQAFVEQLCNACEPVPDPARVADLLAHARPGLEALRPWIAFDPDRYARRRLFRNQRFELILMCWGDGQFTPVHDHDGQSGWITVIDGTLTVQEYDRLWGPRDLTRASADELSRPGSVPLAPARRLVVPAGTSIAEAAAPETIHRVGPDSGRALSLHLYAGPLRSLLTFDPEAGTARRVTL